MNNFQKIQNRINKNPVLADYADLLHYDWQEEDEHAEWVATAPISEIVEWAQGIRDDEQTQIEVENIQDPSNW